MKARVGIIALVLSVSICASVWADADAMDIFADSLDERPMGLTFGQYFEPYEPNIEPNAPGYKLPLDINDIANYDGISRVIPLEQVSNLILQNGFAIVEHSNFLPWDPFGDNIISLYEELHYSQVPLFVTTDTFLHL